MKSFIRLTSLILAAAFVLAATSCSKLDLHTFSDEYDLCIEPVDIHGNPLQSPPADKDDFWEKGYTFSFYVFQAGSYEKGPFYTRTYEQEQGSSGKSVTECRYYATYEGDGRWSLKAYSESEKKYYSYERLTLKSNKKNGTFAMLVASPNYFEQHFRLEFRKKELKGKVTIEHPCM